MRIACMSAPRFHEPCHSNHRQHDFLAATSDHEAHARAYEHLLRLGGDQPVWTGVITKPLLHLMKWGNIKDERLTSKFKEFRCILHAHAKVVWRSKCESVYSPESEKRRLLANRTKKHAKYRPISQIRLGLFLRLKSDLIFSGASSV